MKFLDEAKIYIKAGSGGDGCLSFRREKFIEFGGPDGGNGGRGGSIYAVAVKNVNTLIDYRYQQHFKAKKGGNGAGQNRTGRSSDDVVLIVPVGTQILDEDKVTEIFDLSSEGQKVLLAQGGIGGFGNSHFKTSINQAPRRINCGTSGEEKWIWLKLKLIADIGLVGLPNAGKSSFITAVTNVKAKVGDYPFTTLIPQLGVVCYDTTEIVIADIPGLIEEAHLGKGLGDKFLAHIERCSVLIHMVDISTTNPFKDYINIRKEMKKYSDNIYQKEEIIVLNKEDIVDKNAATYILNTFRKRTKKHVFCASTTNQNDCRKITMKAAEFIKAPPFRQP
jgi:GTP-binding protein